MKKIKRTALCLIICAGMALPTITNADSVLEYLVKESGVSRATTQEIAIKNDKIMVKSVGGDKNFDLLYRHAVENVLIVDHSKSTVMIVDEQQVDRLNQQMQNVQPLLQGIGEEIGKLSSEQRQQLQDLFGDNVSLDTLAKAAEPQAPTRLVPAGMKEVGKIHCRVMRVMQGATPVAEVCLADAATMKISDKDAATIRAFFGFYERLALKSQGLAPQLGLTLPNIAAREMTGIPVEFRDLSGQGSVTMTLRRVNTSPVSPELMRVPNGYKTVPLGLFGSSCEAS
jgi:hypothetical protein